MTLDENHGTQDSVFFSRVIVKSSRPFLLLEEAEHHFEDVVCSPSNIILSFNSIESFTIASEVFSDLVGSVVITSHWGCNDEGARAPFL